MNVDLEPSFVLHASPFRETSVLVHLLTQNYGKVSAVARSARGLRSRFKNCFIPFSPLVVSFRGKGELMQINAAEPQTAAYFLEGKNLFNGLYLNELLMKLLQRLDPYPRLFVIYRDTLEQLQHTNEQPQKVLRVFEKKLLIELGYGLQLSQEATGQQVLPDSLYAYQIDQGVVSCRSHHKGDVIFLGRHLIAIEKNNFESHEVLKEARRLMRLVFNNLLGSYPLKTRELFR